MSRRARAEAAAWLARLHGPERSDELEDDFRGWLAANPEHAEAFEKITNTWDALGGVNIGAIARPQVRVGRGSIGLGRLSIALAVCASIVVAWWISGGERYATRIGEQRIVTLEDGSRLSLDAATSLLVRFTPERRTVEMKRGEALFDVAKDSRRPFVVTAGERSVTALGTSFVVRYDSMLTSVTLVEGKVSVAPVSSSADHAGSSRAPTESVVLAPGERVTYAPAEKPRVDVPRADATAAWRRGEIVLDETPLSIAAADMNRHESRRLVLEGSHVAELPISGIYRIGDNIGFARAVANVYGLDVDVDDDEIRLRER